jgi:DNA-binding response OmpR family regulator
MKPFIEPPCDKAASAPAQAQANLSNRILFVDDNTAVREASSKVLIWSGYQVDVAEDGEAGWEALHATNYDLLITDHNMPKLSGVELVKKLRSARMNLPVVLASGELPTEELNQNPWLELAATLVKPFTIAELLGTVRVALSAAATPVLAQNFASPVLVEVVIPVELLPRWRNQRPAGVAHEWRRMPGRLCKSSVNKP